VGYRIPTDLDEVAVMTLVGDVWAPLERHADPLTATVEIDAVVVGAASIFDYKTDGTSAFTPWRKPTLPETWGIGLIVGGSGTGKSTLLREFGEPSTPIWEPTRAVVSHFSDPKAAMEAMYAVGLSSVPTWIKPYHVLSTGEKFRADLARSVCQDAVIDEYTSVVDRNVAHAASRSLSKYVRANEITNVVLATCHRDVIEWVEPDWIIDTDAGAWCLHPRECLQRPVVVAEIYEVTRSMWPHFMGHHYLATTLHPFARCYIATVEGQVVAFASAIPFPNGHVKNAWREHRTVTLPDFQGLGVGVRLSDWVADAHVTGGYRYFSRTTHPRMGQYRETSLEWRPTSSNLKPQKRNENPNWAHWNFDDRRIAYSHEFIGQVSNTKKGNT
jgi:GNAT superfamily N-acetyltransferase